MTNSTKSPEFDEIQLQNLPRGIEVIFHADLLLRVLIGCKSESMQAIESILTLIYAKEITAYIEDSQLAIVKEYISRFASSYADTLISSLERDFRTYSVTAEDIKRVSELAVESLHTGIAIACAERKKVDIVIAETVQVVYEQSDVCVVNPEEFMLRYDSLNRCLKDDANILHSSIVNTPEKQQKTNLDWIDPIQSIIDIKFGDWNIESFETVIQFKDETKASVKLWNERKGEYIAQNAVGNGPVDALVQALNLSLGEAKLEAIIPPMIVESVYLQSEEKGADSLVRANVSLVIPGDESIRGEFKHTDTVKAVFCACIKATADYINLDKKKRLKNITVAQLKRDLEEENLLRYENVCLQKLDSLPFELLGLSLKYASIAYSNFAGVQIADYSKAAKWEKTSIYYSDLRNTLFANVCLQELEIHNSTFEEANFSCAVFERLKIRSSNLIESQLDKVEFYNCAIANSDFAGANFIYAKFINSVITGTNFKNANFRDCRFKGTSSIDANFANAVFCKSELYHSTFMFANLSNANFSEAKFNDVSFASANLKGVDFTNCDLRGVDFNGAILSNADLTGVIINASQLESANCKNLDKSKIKEIIDGSDEQDWEDSENRLHKCC